MEATTNYEKNEINNISKNINLNNTSSTTEQILNDDKNSESEDEDVFSLTKKTPLQWAIKKINKRSPLSGKKATIRILPNMIHLKHQKHPRWLRKISRIKLKLRPLMAAKRIPQKLLHLKNKVQQHHYISRWIKSDVHLWRWSPKNWFCSKTGRRKWEWKQQWNIRKQ